MESRTFVNGASAGEYSHTLTLSELTPHTHTLNGVNGMTYVGQDGSGGGNAITSTAALTTSSSGSGAAHNNMQPYTVAAIWIRVT